MQICNKKFQSKFILLLRNILPVKYVLLGTKYNLKGAAIQSLYLHLNVLLIWESISMARAFRKDLT
jgi:hypothetical protein